MKNRKIRGLVGSTLTLLAVGTVSAAELPVPCVAGSCGVAAASFVTSGRATVTSTTDSMLIHQETDKAILNWKSFNIGPDGKVVFQQPDSSSIALNRVFQNSPSKIFGALQANGQVYLINQNGIVFGAGSTVNTAGLLASTLNMSDAVFNAGILSPSILKSSDKAALAGANPWVRDEAGKPVPGADGKPIPVEIKVEQGAKLNTSGVGGRVLLASRNVTNAGTIETPDGQTVLAAGEKIYLTASSDPSLRGLVVEVDSLAVQQPSNDPNAPPQPTTGAATNTATGVINTPRGNATLIGLAVNQSGRISATTTVSSNGSVHLLARDTTQIDTGRGTIAASRGGQLTVGDTSRIDILPQLSDTATAVDDQPQLPSTVKMIGQQVVLKGGSQITAKGGEVSFTALPNPSSGINGGLYDPQSRIRVESGASIDVSGSSVTLPALRNMVTVELRANELADSPLQRDSAVRGQTIVVDRRVGTKLADISGALRAIAKSVAERTSEGGTVSFASAGDVVVADNARIDVSGGQVTYESGVIQTTQLMGVDGRLVDIGAADPNAKYIAVINPTNKVSYDRWGVTETVNGFSLGRVEQTYTEGTSAGTLSFAAPNMVLNGTFAGTVKPGAYQRDSSTAPLGGQFIIGVPGFPNGTNSPETVDLRAPSIHLVSGRPKFDISSDANLPGPRDLDLSTDFLTEGGFTRTQIHSNGVVTLADSNPLDLAPGSFLEIDAARIDVGANITALGGSVLLNAQRTFGIGNDLPRTGIDIRDGVTLDVRGLWTNDFSLPRGVTPFGAIYQNGGTISLTVHPAESPTHPSELVLGDDVSLLASGGAWRHTNGTLVGGKGGTISLIADRPTSAFEIGNNVSLEGFGVEGADGGTLSIATTRMEISNGSAWAQAQRIDPLTPPRPLTPPFQPNPRDPLGPLTPVDDSEAMRSGPLRIGTSLFTDHGFSHFTLSASGQVIPTEPGDALVVRDGSSIDLRVRTLELGDALRTRQSGGTAADFGTVTLLPAINRGPADLTLRVAATDTTPPGMPHAGRINIETGTVFGGDPGSSFTFSGDNGLFFGGVINAPSGKVKFATTGPTDLTLEPGYLPDLRLEIGAHARVDTSGVAVIQPSDRGLLIGSVLDGGSISLLAGRGSINVQSGAEFSVAGTSAPLDLQLGTDRGLLTRAVVASNAGSFEMRSGESIAFAGTLDAHAGVGDTGTARGGTLTFALTRAAGRGFVPSQNPTAGDPFPTAPSVIHVLDTPLAVGGTTSGEAFITAEQIRATGADALRLESDGAIAFDPNVSLSLGRSLTLDSAAISMPAGGSVLLQAPYVAFGNTVTNIVPNPVVDIGGGVLDVRGNQIDLVGTTNLLHIGQATFTSRGDIRLQGLGNNDSVGALRTNGDLTLQAVRVHGSTSTTFTLSASGGTDNTIRFVQNGSSPGAPLSAATALTVVADNIIQGGSLYAPFGTIKLNATKSLSLLDGSTTSVSAAGMLIPFGRVEIGTDWIYTDSGKDTQQNGIPNRRIELSAPDVVTAKSSTIDLRGGGDLYAYEWAPGTGGHTDALDPKASPGLYAIIPGLAGNFAPYDPQEYQASDLHPGDSIYLSGGGGVPAGTYALLPARYALLPGAYLVRAVKGTQDLQPNARITLSDGAPVVSGYRTFATTGIGNTRSSGFSIRPGSFGRQLAAYNDYKASTFFPAQAVRQDLGRVPMTVDAGSLGFSAETTLDVRGSVLSAAASGGRGAAIDVSATHLQLTSSPSAAAEGVVQLDTSVVSSWNASQLLLGGRKSADGTSIEVLADTVDFAAGTTLALDQIAAVALDEVSIGSGARITSRSAAASQPAKLDAAPVKVSLTGDGAAGAVMLAVSDFSTFDITRPQAAGSASPGRVTLAAGSVLGSRGSLLLDAPGGALLDGTLNGAGASWTLASRHIAFGDEPIEDGITVTSALAPSLSQGANLSFISSGTIDFATNLAFGATTNIDSLAFEAASLRNLGTDNKVSFAARSILFGGKGAADAQSVATGDETGTLAFSADNFLIGPGTLTLEGFESQSLAARGEIRTEETTALRAATALDLTASRLTASSGATSEIASNSTLRIFSANSPLATLPPLELGGALTLRGRDIETSGAIVMPSGLLSMKAERDLTIHSGASFDVSGVEVSAAGRTVGSPGGTILLAAGGNLTAERDSRFALSGMDDEEAGRLYMQTGGIADIGAASYAARSTGAGTGGTFTLDAGSLADFAGLNARLEAGGFSRERNVRVATGDLELGAGNAMTARFVKLVADGGSVRIGGSIMALSDNERATIDLYGTNGVELQSGSLLRAEGVGNDGRGGMITLGTTTGGMLDLLAGSSISTSGTAGNGSVLLRAPAIGNDVAISHLGTTFAGVSEVNVEPFLSFDAPSVVAANEFAAYAGAVSQYGLVARTNLVNRVGDAGRLLHVRPGMELRSDGDIDIGGIDLSTWRFYDASGNATEPGALTVRAGGSIRITGNISDGFATSSDGLLDLMDTTSATLRFTAGARLGSADTGAIVPGALGDLIVGGEAGGVTVRTGTGDIRMAAAHDVKILGPTGATTGSTVYTMGLAGVPADALSNNRQVIWFPTDGGRVSLYAGHDVVGSTVTQSVGQWEIRGGRDASQTTRWGTRIPQFKWNVGTLGGGDIDIRSGNDVLDLSVAAADSAYEQSPGSLTRFKGGVLTVDAGHDISAIYAHATNGVNRLHAEGSFTHSPNRLLPLPGLDPGASVFSFQDAQYALSARGDITIETVFHPTMLAQPGAAGQLVSYFTTYSDDSAFSARSLSGDVVINPRADAFLLFNGAFGSDSPWTSILPPQVTLRSLSRDVVVEDQISTSAFLSIAPSDQGQFDLFAARDFLLDSSIIESDAAASNIPTPLSPASQPLPALRDLYSGRRADDPTPSLVTAGRDIVVAGTGANRLVFASSSRITAGRDIVNLALRGQNVRPDDVTSISAGRDLYYKSDVRESLIEVGGPGRLDILAGRDVDFGFSEGASTVGGILNPALQKLGGADLTVLAGLANGMDVVGFVDDVVAKTPDNQKRLIAYVESETGKTGLTYDAASAAFEELDPLAQRPFVLETFFRELVASGREANEHSELGFERGYAAIDALFPKSRPTSADDPPSPYAGDIKLAFSKVYTLAGGNISLLAPGGLLNVGLANPPPRLNLNRPPSQLGIVAQGPGDVRIFTNDDVLVNESRAFTLGGGDIAVWSTTGDIDAGRGAKSSVSAPPPRLTIDEKGNVVVDFGGAVAGSGIRTIVTSAAVKPGNVDLIAPAGIVNAGDAGIGAAGNLNVAAAQVVGLDNIQVGGTSTGVPAETSNLGASLSGVSSVSSSATNAASSSVEEGTRKEGPAPLAETALGWLDVFVEGFGEDVCKSNDAECLNRNRKTP